MDNKHYIAALKKHLRRLDKKNRKDILREVEAAAADDPNTRLASRFGPVEQLAEQYLQDVPESTGGWPVLTRISKWLLTAIGLLVLVIALVLGWLYCAYVHDDFDYRDLQATEFRALNWTQADTAPRLLRFYQAEIVIYPSGDGTLHYACAGGHDFDWQSGRGDDSAASPQALQIQRNKCFLKIPANTTTHIEAEQAQLVLVGIEHNMAVQLKQVQLRVAAEQPLAFQFDLKECRIDGLANQPNAVATLKLSGEQCQVSAYSYD